MGMLHATPHGLLAALTMSGDERFGIGIGKPRTVCATLRIGCSISRNRNGNTLPKRLGHLRQTRRGLSMRRRLPTSLS